MTDSARSRLGTMAAVALLGALAAIALPAPARAARQLETGILTSGPFYGPDAGLALDRTRDAGARAVRIQIAWREVAPATRPGGFDASNPAEPTYRWFTLDRLIQAAVAHGLQPFVTIADAPTWAERGSGGRPGTNRPDPAELGRFAEAVARRYSGSYAALPRVRAFEVWNEVNASFFLYPQEEGHRAVSPALYRQMVNEFAAGVHRVHADNLIVAGGLFPFVLERPNVQAVGPLRFMRELLCISTRLHVRRHCGAKVHFDVWSHHPYTSGGPTHRTGNLNSVSIRELPRMRRLLSAAIRLKRVVHRRPVRFWVTEFSWDSNPPDPHGVPAGLHARWVAEALYRMWRAGVSLVTWLQLRDDAANGRPDNVVFQSGLYLRCSTSIQCDTPKLALTAFRFPFVAFRARGRIRFWGRAPDSRRHSVIVEQATRRGWKRVSRLRSNRFGIFARHVRTSRRGSLRARLPNGGATSLPFSLKRPPDLVVNPFG